MAICEFASKSPTAIVIPDKFLTAPNPNCYICAAEPAIHLRIEEFREEVRKNTLYG